MGKNAKPKDSNNNNNNISNNLKLPNKISNKNSKKFEPFNVVSETGDSIYSPQYEEFTTLYNNGYKCQIFISESAIEEIVNRIIDQRLGNSINNSKENDG